MANVMCIHIGGAGVTIGIKFWELLCAQYGIRPDGMLVDASSGDAFRMFFSQPQSGKNVPQALFIDSEPTITDRILRGDYRSLFEQRQFIAGQENAAGLYARGKHRVTSDLLDQIIDRIRRQTALYDDLQGFIVVMGLGGGTGTGLGTAILEWLSKAYHGLPKMVFALYPNVNDGGTPIVAPYNSLFALSEMMTMSDACVLLENERVSQYCESALDFESPLYFDLNVVMTLVMAEILKPLMCDDRPSSLSELISTMVSTAGLTFITPCYEKFVGRHNSEPMVMPETWRRESDLWADQTLHSLPAVAMLNDASTNREVVEQLFDTLRSKFDALYQHRWFTDWYVREGMDLGEFQEKQKKLALFNG